MSESDSGLNDGIGIATGGVGTPAGAAGAFVLFGSGSGLNDGIGIATGGAGTTGGADGFGGVAFDRSLSRRPFKPRRFRFDCALVDSGAGAGVMGAAFAAAGVAVFAGGSWTSVPAGRCSAAAAGCTVAGVSGFC